MRIICFNVDVFISLTLNYYRNSMMTKAMERTMGNAAVLKCKDWIFLLRVTVHEQF